MRAEKQVVIEELKAKIEAASALIFTSYTGTSAEQMGALRGLLHERRGGYMVVKNRLFARAAAEAGVDGELPGFAGQVGVVFADEDSSVPVLKALVEFQKANEVVSLLGGLVGGRPCTAEELKELAKLPSKAVMRAQVLGTLLAVPRGMVSVLAGRLRSLLYLINAYIEKRGGVPEAAEAVEELAVEQPAVEPAAAEEQPAAAEEQPAAQDGPSAGEAPADAESQEPGGQGGTE